MDQIISASRRTDVIASNYEWLLTTIKAGEAKLQNPYFPTKEYVVSLKQEDVHSIILWSKDFTNFVRNPSVLSSYSLFFQYTMNSYPSEIESVKPIEYQVTNIKWLADNYGEERLTVRFDPVLFYYGETLDEAISERLFAFERLLAILNANIDVTKIGLVTSYLTENRMIRSNLKSCGVPLFHPDDKTIVRFFQELLKIAEKYHATLSSCADPRLLPAGLEIKGCIDGERIQNVTKKPTSHAKDRAQRKFCNCTKSTDIGIYPYLHGGTKCVHQCKYCYVKEQIYQNPQPEVSDKKN